MIIEIKSDEEFKGILRDIKEGLEQLAADISRISGVNGIAADISKISGMNGSAGAKSRAETNRATGSRDREDANRAPGLRGRVDANHEAGINEIARTSDAEETGDRTETAHTASETGNRIRTVHSNEAEGRIEISQIEELEGSKTETEQQPPKNTLSLEEVRGALALLLPQRAKKLISTYGVPRLTELPESCYEDLMKKAGEILC